VVQINSADTVSSEKFPGKTGSRTWVLPFGLFLFVLAIESIDASSFAPVMAQIKRAWDMTDTHVGIYTGMAGLIPILVAVPIGEAVRRWGAKRSVMGSMVFIFIGTIIMATAKGFAQGLAGRIFAAGGLRMGTVASWAGATMIAPAPVRTTAWTVMNTALAVGAITGPLLVGGYIGGNFGWQAVFFTMSALSVFCIILIGFFLRMPSAGIAAPESTVASTTASRFNVYKCWDIYLMGIIFNLMIGSSLVTIMSFAPLAMEQRWQMDPQSIGNILGLSNSVGLPVMLVAGVLADKLRTRKKIMIATAVPMAVGLFMLTSQDQTIFTLGLVGYLGFAFAPGAMLYACAPEMVPKGTNLGPVYGLLSTISSAGAFVTPIVVGLIRDVTGDYNTGFILLGTLCTLSLLLSFKLRAR
jgi:NNP family nitrate/nitrite transporter-like MFS transporter